jgi:hypothetical protein
MIVSTQEITVVPAGEVTVVSVIPMSTVVSTSENVTVVSNENAVNVIALEEGHTVVPYQEFVTVVAGSETGTGNGTYVGPAFFYQPTPPLGAVFGDFWVKTEA